MRAYEFITEIAAPTNTSKPTTTNQAPEVNALTAKILGLQRQIQDLQKAALTNPGQNINQQPDAQDPGDATQQNSLPQTSNTGTSTTKPMGGVKPMGSTPSTIVPGVNQTPQVTNMKIKQDLARNQGSGL